MYACRNVAFPSTRAAAGCLSAVLLAAAAGQPAGADDLQLRIDGGRVTLIAVGTPLAAVLAEWSRVGGTRFVGADGLPAEPLTLHLVDVTEAQALRLLLRAAPGYVAAPRGAPAPGTSRYDRVAVLTARTSSGTEPAPAPPAPGGRTNPAPAPGAGADPVTANVQAQLDRLQGVLDGSGGAGADAAASASPPPDAGGGAPASNVAVDHLRHLLGAAAARQGDAGREPAPEDAAPAPVTTPFPGMVAAPDAERPARERRRGPRAVPDPFTPVPGPPR